MPPTSGCRMQHARAGPVRRGVGVTDGRRERHRPHVRQVLERGQLRRNDVPLGTARRHLHARCGSVGEDVAGVRQRREVGSGAVVKKLVGLEYTVHHTDHMGWTGQ